MRRRDFLRRSGAALGAAWLAPGAAASCAPGATAGAGRAGTGSAAAARLYDISLAQWSLHRTLRAGELDPLEFPRHTRDRFGLDAVEYVNQFYVGRATDQTYLAELKQRADDAGVRSLLIMCDGEGALGDPEAGARSRAVQNHQKWLDAAAYLGCHSIRVNAQSSGSYDEQIRLAADGLRRLAERAEPHGLNVLVENHGGLSSNGAWLAAVMRTADHPRVGTLPDFGNFTIRADPEEVYDRYRGVAELMPWARAVSAKSHDFNASGDETGTDYRRMMRIVLDAGYRGYVGIEYEGSRLSEAEGIDATLRLLERVREELTPVYRS